MEKDSEKINKSIQYNLRYEALRKLVLRENLKIKEYMITTNNAVYGTPIISEEERLLIETMKILLMNVESKTGNKYQVDLRKFGSSFSFHYGNFIKILPFDDRRIQVYNMSEGYELLEGIYESTEEITVKIETLKLFDYGVKDDGDWECSKCGQKNEGIIDACVICQSCSCRMPESIWEYVGVHLNNGKIGKGGGGSISRLDWIGKIELL